MDNQTVVVLDFGGQYNQLIARRVRECGVYCELLPYNTKIEKLKKLDPIGIILTGGPNSVTEKGAPVLSEDVLMLGVPILGICYGAQFLVYGLGGEIGAADKDSAAEFGRTDCNFDTKSLLFKGLKKKSVVWMSHNDYIKKLPDGFRSAAHSEKCPFGAIENPERKFYGTQFHPEVNHTEQGFDMLGNFLFNVCGCKGDWTMQSYAETATRELREKIGDGKALLALSGGVDSSVACKLLANAIGGRLTCIFVDHGLMRKNEGDEVEAAFADSGVNFVRVNAGERFLKKLKGVSEPEKKRKIIGAILMTITT